MQTEPRATSPPAIDTRPLPPAGQRSGEGLKSVLEHLLIDPARRVSEAGHEIGCHTFSHLDCGQASTQVALDDVAQNTDALASWGVGEAVSFAYPYGDVASPAKTALAGRFKTLRALHHGLIANGADLNQAPAVGIEGEDGESVANAWLDKAKARKAWLILYTHEIGRAHV